MLCHDIYFYDYQRIHYITVSDRMNHSHNVTRSCQENDIYRRGHKSQLISVVFLLYKYYNCGDSSNQT